MITMIRLEISYSEFFTEWLFTLLMILSIMDIILYQIFSRVILNEALLVSPFMAGLALSKIIVLLAAKSFIDYV